MPADSKNKTVRFDKVFPFYLDQQEDGASIERLLDLRAILVKLADTPFQRTIKDVYGDKCRFHACRKENDNRIWEIQILRLRDNILPGIATEDGEYSLFELEDGEYPAESNTLLYDEGELCLYLQRNMYGLSPKSLACYFQQLMPAETLLLFKPQISGNRIEQITNNKQYRKIVLAMDDTNRQFVNNEATTPLGRILRVFNRYQGKVISVEIGFGHKRGFLRSDEIVRLVHEAYGSEDVKKLQTRMYDPEDDTLQTVDLLADREGYSITFEYSRQNPITHDRLYRRCREEFLRQHRR